MTPFDSASDFWDSMGIRYENAFGHEPSLLSFLEDSVKLLRPRGSILDLGSGTGKPKSAFLVEKGFSVHGIDISPVMVELASKQVPKGTFELADALTFQPQRTYDALFTCFSLFNIPLEDLQRLIRRWQGWIEPRGYVFIATIAAGDLRRARVDPAGCSADVDHLFMGHRIKNLVITKLGWTKLLKDNGFEIVSTREDSFQAPPEAQCDVEPHFYIIARRVV